jgi:hypothetical protein
MKMEHTGFSETSASKIQTPRNYPEESIKHNGLQFHKRLAKGLLVFQEGFSSMYKNTKETSAVIMRIQLLIQPNYTVFHHIVPHR